MKRIFKRMPRLNVIIGKKQIIIAGLTMVLGVAIYVNYLAAQDSGLLKTETADTGGESVNYGDAAFVSGGSANNAVNTDLSAEIAEYFTKARLDKQESRDEAKEFLAAMYNGGDSTGEYLEVLARDAAQMKTYIESETKIETVLKAQGFPEVLCYLSDKGANIIVKTEGLDAAGAAKIKDALLSEVDISAENITIVEIN